MSAAQHRSHAARDEAASQEHASLSVLDLSSPASLGTEPLPPGTQLWLGGALGDVHASHAARFARHAREHAAAAAALESAETAACHEAPAGSRGTCPLEAGVASIEAIEGGVRIHLLPDASTDDVTAALRCHLARAATLGHAGMEACPLYAEGLSVRADPGARELDLIAPDAAGAAALHKAILESLP